VASANAASDVIADVTTVAVAVVTKANTKAKRMKILRIIVPRFPCTDDRRHRLHHQRLRELGPPQSTISAAKPADSAVGTATTLGLPAAGEGDVDQPDNRDGA
jgi:hypothetical protein